MQKKVNEFKVFCVANGIRQKVLSKKADVGITSLHYLQNEGKASPKTIQKIVDCLNRDFKINISFYELQDMVIGQ